jgi:hypothetical protein
MRANVPERVRSTATVGVGIMKPRRRLLLVAGLIVSLLLVAGCDGDIGDGISTTEGGGQTTTTGEGAETTTTEAPDTTASTEAPETTATTSETGETASPDTDEETSDTQRYILIGLLVLAFIVIVIVAIRASRRSKKPEPSAAAASTWKATAGQAYAQSRWLYENLTPAIGQWRGDWLHAGEDTSADRAYDAASAQQQTWSQLGTQMAAATSTLYSLEAQVDPASQQVVRSVIDVLNNTRAAVDDVASARLAVNQATDAVRADSGNGRIQQNLAAAHDRENQSVQNLNGNRTVLQGALANLAALR